MIIDILYFSGVYLGGGFLFNLLVSNIYKRELINFLFESGLKDIQDGKINSDEFLKKINLIENNFLIFSISFSFVISSIFPIFLVRALFGKNPFPVKNLDI